MPRTRRTIAHASAQHPARPRMPARSQSAHGPLAIRRRREWQIRVVPLRRCVPPYLSSHLFLGCLPLPPSPLLFFFFWFRFFCRLGYPRYGFHRGRWMGLVLMVCSRFDRRRPPTRSYGRVTYARFPDATSRSRTDDNGHCARRDEARHRRSRFVPQPLTHHTPGLLVLARIVPLEDIPYVVRRARF